MWKTCVISWVFLQIYIVKGCMIPFQKIMLLKLSYSRPLWLLVFSLTESNICHLPICISFFHSSWIHQDNNRSTSDEVNCCGLQFSWCLLVFFKQAEILCFQWRLLFTVVIQVVVEFTSKVLNGNLSRTLFRRVGQSIVHYCKMFFV